MSKDVQQVRRLNSDAATVKGFGNEWGTFDQISLGDAEKTSLFDNYFSIFPFEDLPPRAVGFDLGCGSGRWASMMAGRVGLLHCIDASGEALEVARRALEHKTNVQFHHESVDTMTIADGSQDFGYSLGVLHHVPDTASGVSACVRKLKSGAPFLLYLYYNFDNRPRWFRWTWSATNLGRRIISRMPFGMKKLVTDAIAVGIYYPVARFSLIAERCGADIANFPLSSYRDLSFYTMRTDALDRFGTQLEQRFSRTEIKDLMLRSGLENIVFRDESPFWVACGRKRAALP